MMLMEVWFIETSNGMYELYNGDCLEILPTLDCKVDLVLTDPPYGVTQFSWDNKLNYEDMWLALKNVTAKTTPICLFGVQPFISELVNSNTSNYKYEWIWSKSHPTNPFVAKYQPMRYHENILVFYEKFGKYNPQMIERAEGGKKRVELANKKNEEVHTSNAYTGGTLTKRITDSASLPLSVKNPSTIIHSNSIGTISKEKIHFNKMGLEGITQKPVSLLEYFIRTYTDEGDTVLDFTMGSGSTGVACGNLNRKFVGIELNKDYFKIAKDRIKEAYE